MAIRNRRGADFRNMDYLALSLFLALVLLGWAMLYAVSHADLDSMPFLETAVGKQTIWIGISFIAFFLLTVVDWKFWQTFAYAVYCFTILLLVGVLIFGVEIKGQQSWFSLGGLTIQPAEFAKFGTALAMASFLGAYHLNIRTLKHQAYSVGIFILPMALILLQPDAGSAIVFSAFLLVLYREGMPTYYFLVGIYLVLLLILGILFKPGFILLGLLCLGGLLLVGRHFKSNWYLFFALVWVSISIYLVSEDYLREVLIGTGTVFAILALMALSRRGQTKIVGVISAAIILGTGLAFASNHVFENVLQPHQQDRINVWLRPADSDPQGSLYNLLQSKLAIGSGGLWGKGFLQGTMTRLNYVPEQSTDFIFCTVGEQQGFIGSLGIIVLFLLLLLRLIKLAERQRNSFARIYIYSVAGIIFIHFFINIGMTMGIMPIIGIPLPFLSKGGSALLGFTIMFAVLLNLDSHRYRI